jgi:hypothetical protein
MKQLLEWFQGIKLSRFTFSALIAVGGVLLLWLTLMLFTGMSSSRTGPVKIDPNKCPDCGREYSMAGRAAKECTYCMLQAGTGDKKDKERARLRAGGKDGQTSYIVPLTLFGIFLVMLGVHLTVVWRAAAAAAREEIYYHTNCLKCDRKIRYRENQIGKVVGCPNPKCKSFIRCPEPVQEPSRPWWQFWGGQNQAASAVEAGTEPAPEPSAKGQAGQ